MLNIIKLLFNYWKRSMGVPFCFVFPIISLLVFRSFTPLQSILPTILISSSLSNGIFGLGITYADIRNSVIMKKIRTLPLPKWKVILGIISFNFFIICLSSLWIFSFAVLFFRSGINFSQINWFYFILAIFLAITMGSVTGFLVGSFAPNAADAASSAFIIISTPVTFFSGQYIQINLLKKSNILSSIAKLFPFTYPFDIIRRSSFHNNLPAISNNLLFTDYLKPIIFSLLWISSLFVLAFYVYNSQKE